MLVSQACNRFNKWMHPLPEALNFDLHSSTVVIWESWGKLSITSEALQLYSYLLLNDLSGVPNDAADLIILLREPP